MEWVITQTKPAGYDETSCEQGLGWLIIVYTSGVFSQFIFISIHEHYDDKKENIKIM